MKCPFCKTEKIEIPKKILNKKILLEVFKCLTPRDYVVLWYRIVLEANLQETGRVFYVTSERIRQLEARAFRKLRKWFKDNCDRDVEIESILELMREEKAFWPFPPVSFVKYRCFGEEVTEEATKFIELVQEQEL